MTHSDTRAQDQQSSWVEPQVYYAQLASVHVATGALITDHEGRVLLVKPNYRPHWLFPGGMADDGEPPEAACARELREELGLETSIGRLLVVDWAPPMEHRLRPILFLLFDAGIMHEANLRLQQAELDDAAFLPADEATTLLSRSVAGRLPAALTAREQGITIYRPTAEE